MHCEQKMKTLINEYKRILKRHMPRNQAMARIQTLTITRKDLRRTTHAMLYQRSTAVLSDIDALIASKNHNPSCYSGLRSFASHLREALTNHVMNEHDKIINAPQKASKAVIDTIQIINYKPIDTHLQKIKENILTAIKYGSREQKTLLIKALNRPSLKYQTLNPLIEQLAN